MEAKLVVVGGKANKAEITLKLPTMVGRGRDADLTVSHATVSRHHCLLFELDGALVVRDNGSLNGTMVAGQRVKEAVIKPGDMLTIGPLTFRADYEHAGGFPTIGEQPTKRSTDETLPAAANGAPMGSGDLPTIDFDPSERKSPTAAAKKQTPVPAVQEESFPELDFDGGSPGTAAAADSTGNSDSGAPDIPPLDLPVSDGKDQAGEPDEEHGFDLLEDDVPPAKRAPATVESPSAPVDEYELADEPAASRSKQADPPNASRAANDQIDDAALAFLNEIGPEPESDVSALPQIAPAKQVAASLAKGAKPGKAAKSSGDAKQAKPSAPAEKAPDYRPPDGANPPGAGNNELDDFLNSLGLT